MNEDLLTRLRAVDPAPAARIEREGRAMGDLPARVASERVVVPLRRRVAVRRVGVGIAAAIVVAALVVPLALLSPLGRGERGGAGEGGQWLSVGTLDEIRDQGVVYLSSVSTFVVAEEGQEPRAFSAVPLEDPREATRERVLFCPGTQEFLGSRGDRYDVRGQYMAPAEVDHGLAVVASRVVDGMVQVDPSHLTPGDPNAVPASTEAGAGCQTADGVPLEGAPGFGIPIGTELPPIAVALPQRDMDVWSPVHVVGSANVFEATVSIRILDSSGAVIAESFATATCGTGCRGLFGTDVEFTVDREQPGTVQVFEASAEDGSPTHMVEAPVTLRPSAQQSAEPEGLVGTWFDADGNPLPDGSPGDGGSTLAVFTGPEHCDWQSATFMHLAWPLGSVSVKFRHERQYIRDPEGILGDALVVGFDPDATLPDDAVDTGYHRGPWHLWISEREAQGAVYVVNAETGMAERWGKTIEPVLCM